MDIVPFATEHLESAAALVCRRYALLTREAPALPPRYADPATILPRLRDIMAAAPAVAALDRGMLVGFLAAWLLPSFRGQPGVFSPEWANAALLEVSAVIYERMYARLAATWVADGHIVHGIAMLANDREGLAGWSWLGFGMAAADAVRDLQPVRGLVPDVAVRRAGPADLDAAAALDQALCDHLAASPVFLLPRDTAARNRTAQRLADPAMAIWLAEHEAEPLAYLTIGPANHDASDIIHDPKTASIVGAYTKPEVRREGVATALLDRALAWAQEAGYTRCAVDFEPMNAPAARFWLRHFMPVVYSVVRHVDARASMMR